MLLIAIVRVELTLEHELAMTQRIDDVHREHDLVERRLLFRGGLTHRAFTAWRDPSI